MKLKLIGKYTWEFINSKVFFIILAVIIGFFFIQSLDNSNDLKRELKINEQNLLASKDTIKIIKNKNGDLEASKSIYITSEKELKNVNSTLNKKIKNIEGELITANRTVFKLKQDTTDLKKQIKYLKKKIGESIKINDSTWIMPWEIKYQYDSTNYDLFNGKTIVGIFKFNNKYSLKHIDTELINRETQIDLVFGQRIVDGKFNVYIKTSYPGFKPSILDGALIDPNDNKYIKELIKKRQFLPNTWNIGVGATVGYDFLNLRPAIVVGASITYSLYQW